MLEKGYFIRRRDFRVLACIGLIFLAVGFFSCATSPDAESTPRRAENSENPAVDNTPVIQSREEPLGTMLINYVDTVTLAFSEGQVQLFQYPDRNIYGMQIPVDAGNTYKQLWDDESMELLIDAVSRFATAERGERFGYADTRSFTAYGTTESTITEWIQGSRNTSAETRIDLGYMVKDRKAYFLITQRDVPVGEASATRTARITYCVSMDQLRLMMEKFSRRLYEKPLLVFLGDSVTAGTSATIQDEEDPASAYPAILQTMLTINILNSGVSWDSTELALERIEDVIKYDPDVVVINLGLTDFIERTAPSETLRNLQSIINALKSNDRKIYLTRFYDEFILRDNMLGWEMSDKEQDDLYNEYEGIFRTLSRLNDVELITGVWDGLQYDDTISTDFMNPTAEGHKIMAGNFFNALRSYMGTHNFLK